MATGPEEALGYLIFSISLASPILYSLPFSSGNTFLGLYQRPEKGFLSFWVNASSVVIAMKVETRVFPSCMFLNTHRCFHIHVYHSLIGVFILSIGYAFVIGE